jgi:omega-6 fatty acid desaturase (delta-12 desaturase)
MPPTGASIGRTDAYAPVSLESSPRVPVLAKVPFSVAEIRAAIPAHCFKRSLTVSLSYAARDIALLVLFGYLATFISGASAATLAAALAWGAPAAVAAVAGGVARVMLWCAYWYASGCVGTGLWMIGHECGHGAFSEYEAVNFVVGLLTHSAVLVPYWSWALTHSRHHKFTNSREDDEPHVPATRESYLSRRVYGSLIESGAFSGVSLLLMLVFGWPLYLLIDFGGPGKHNVEGRTRDHFSPWSVHFDALNARQTAAVVTSTAAIAAAVSLIAFCGATFGVSTVFAYYIVPLLIVNAHLVIITFLQHTHAGVPHLKGEAFTWLRGALCTIDRSWGPLRDHVFHHISDTHVVHHLFHELPFYHAVEATAAVRKLLGAHALRDDTPMETALWREFRECKFSEEVRGGEPGIEWMRSTADAKEGVPGIPLTEVRPLAPHNYVTGPSDVMGGESDRRGAGVRARSSRRN